MKEIKIGEKFNEWTVIDGPFKINGKDHYKLKCKCGKEEIKEKRYILSSLFSISCRSCSLKRRKDNEHRKYDIGTKVLNLTILSLPKLYKGNSIYKVLCDCGHVYYTGHSTLHRKLNNLALPYCNACFSTDKKKPKRNTMLTLHISLSLYNRLVYNANHRGIEFNVSPEYLELLWIKQNGKCALSGVDILLSIRAIDVKNTVYSASLDRIDSNLGYVEGNVLWVHKYINYMKCDFTLDEFIYFCKQVAKTQDNQQPSIEYTQ